MFEQSDSEARRGKINTIRRDEISKQRAFWIENEKRKSENNKKREERNREIGNNEDTGKNIMAGSRDRMLAVLYDANKFSNVTSQNAYKDGFFRHGNNSLLANIDRLSDEALEEIGYNDNLSGVDFDTLPDKIKKNDSYVKGYMGGIVLANKKRK